MPASDIAATPTSVRRRRLGLAIRVAVIAIVVAGIWWMVRGMHIDALGHALRRARWWPLVIAGIGNFAILFFKAASWRVMLAPTYRVPMWRLYRYTLTAFAASVIVPARAGEVLRVWLLKRRDGVPVTASTAVAIAEKLLDAVSMLLVASPLPWLLPGLPDSISWWIGGLAMFAIVAFIALRLAIDRVRGDGWLARLIAGMEVLRRPRALGLALGSLLLGWLLDLSAMMLVAYAVGIPLTWAGGILVLFTLNLTIAAPSTPGQVGALELGAMIGLELLHVPRAQGLAFALLYHAIQVVPLVIIGIVLDAKLMFGQWTEDAVA